MDRPPAAWGACFAMWRGFVKTSDLKQYWFGPTNATWVEHHLHVPIGIFERFICSGCLSERQNPGVLPRLMFLLAPAMLASWWWAGPFFGLLGQDVIYSILFFVLVFSAALGPWVMLDSAGNWRPHHQNFQGLLERRIVETIEPLIRKHWQPPPTDDLRAGETWHLYIDRMEGSEDAYAFALGRLNPPPGIRPIGPFVRPAVSSLDDAT